MPKAYKEDPKRPSKAECPFCHRMIYVNTNRRIARHFVRQMVRTLCPGTGKVVK